MRIPVAIALAALAVSCSPAHEQHIEFKGFVVERGVYSAEPGWHFEPQGDGTFIALRANDSGGKIEPCACALETGGSCDQATLEGENGDIIEIWCVDNGCGFCVGGTTVDPDDPSTLVRFRVECLDRARVSAQSR